MIAIAPLLTLALSLPLLYRYRRSVTRIMDELSGYESPVESHSADLGSPGVGGGPVADARPVGADRQALCAALDHAPRRNLLRYLLAGLAFAAVLTVAAVEVFDNRFGFAGFLIALWIYLWPAFLARPLIMRGSRWQALALWFAAYVVVYALLSAWTGTIHNLPEYRFGALVIPPRSTATPEAMLLLWWSANGVPSLLMILALNRRIRAVAPLVLAFSSIAVSGLMGAWFALFTRHGSAAIVAAAEVVPIRVDILLLAALLVAIALFGWVGWLLMRWIARARRRRLVSDQTLQLDALWLLFAATYSMWLSASGIAWAVSGLLAFAAFKLTLRLAAPGPPREPAAQLNLTFLRVFALGRRSERLFEQIEARWRYLGAIQLIAGPDLARSTIRPDQFLDFLAGKLRQHFVGDPVSLAQALADRDLTAGADRQYRMHGFFCYADSWKAVLPELVADSDLVLMDLRAFSADNAGCLHELYHLVTTVPYARCLLVVDETTDGALLDRTLEELAASLVPGTPNHGRPVTELMRHHLASGSGAAAALLQRLCAMGAVVQRG